MRLLLSIFFIITTPLALFLVSILFGGITSVNLKSTILESGIYQKAEFLVEDPNIARILSPDYLQKKSEKAIDDSALWLTGKSDNAPVISFKDVKEEFLSANPELLEAITELPSDSVEQVPGSSGLEGENPEEMLNSLVKNDFEFSLKDSLASVKFTRSFISVLLPVQLIIMALCLFGLVVLSHSISSKLRWIGITLLLSSLFGWVIFFTFEVIIGFVLNLVVLNSNEVIADIYPIIKDSLELLVSKNKEFQILTSITLGIIGVVCTALSFMLKSNTNHKATPKIKKKTT